MRQLKFRIWDRQTKQFVHNSAGTHCASRWLIDAFTGRPVDFVVGFEDPEFGSLSGGEDYYMEGTKVVKEPRYVVQQWTGVLDKTGKEIYEGDIVTTRVLKLTQTGIVKWLSSGFAINRDGYWLTSFIPVEKIRIIGNIFEDPELLKQ